MGHTPTRPDLYRDPPRIDGSLPLSSQPESDRGRYPDRPRRRDQAELPGLAWPIVARRVRDTSDGRRNNHPGAQCNSSRHLRSAGLSPVVSGLGACLLGAGGEQRIADQLCRAPRSWSGWRNAERPPPRSSRRLGLAPAPRSRRSQWDCNRGIASHVTDHLGRLHSAFAAGLLWSALVFVLAYRRRPPDRAISGRTHRLGTIAWS